MRDEVAAVRKRLERFTKDGKMPIGVCQRLISDTAWWHGHPQGPARAPNHYKRVTSGVHGWEIEFGANLFLVEKAIRRCISIITEHAFLAERTRAKVDAIELRYSMSLQVRSAVAKYNGAEYKEYYDTVNGFMLFGTQAINVNDFVATMSKLSDLHCICIEKKL